MSLTSGHARVGLTISRDTLIISVQVELYNDVLHALQNDALSMMQKHHLQALILDLSHVHLIDYDIAKQLANTLVMAKLLGAACVIAGIQPNIAAAMSDWGDIWQGFTTVRHVDGGLTLLHHA
ncbi:MAG: hypothetical protein COB79_06295 [Zetaproteobacteria bacterium]|nr:MAG: hypothetical protein COB79_06295 [Zetaproteobacteria bacterium]